MSYTTGLVTLTTDADNLREVKLALLERQYTLQKEVADMRKPETVRAIAQRQLMRLSTALDTLNQAINES